MSAGYEVLVGDCRESLRTIPDQSVHCVVTSPPYFGLRDYGVDGQIGLEQTPTEFVAKLVEAFREVRRALRDDGTLWLNLGDSYASAWAMPGGRRNVAGQGSLSNGKRANRPNRLVDGLKEKDLMGIPWRVAFALQADGWYLRQDIIWSKPNPMPEGKAARDRCTKSHEYIFLMSKSRRYRFDSAAMSDDAKNRRSVWSVSAKPFKGAHFATFPPDLIEPCILAGCPEGGTVLDPFGGSGTTAGVAIAHGRKAVICELNPGYAALMPARVAAILARHRSRMAANDNQQLDLISGGAA